MTVYTDTLTDGVMVASKVAMFYGGASGLVDTVAVSARVSVTWRLTATLTDRLLVSTAVFAPGIYHMTMASAIKMRDAIFSARTATLIERIAVTSSLSVVTRLKLIEAVKLSSLFGVQAVFNVALQDSMTLGDLLGSGSLIAMHDHIVVEDQLAPIYRAVAMAQDAIDLTDDIGLFLRVVVTGQDMVELSDQSLVQAIYRGYLSDQITIGFELAETTGNVTTWAMNARTGSLSEYTNYAFNSFAQMGDVYLAADDEGVHELVGDQDQIDPIIVSLKGGAMELAGSHFTGLKAAYLAIRGQGEFYLKLEGTSGSTIYRVVASTLRTARVNLGKGWRSRYLTWELTSTGQDFDLEGLEFLPITSTRRV